MAKKTTNMEAGELVLPIEDALREFMEAGIPEAKTEKGIPLVSFVVKEGDCAVFIKPFPLPVADRYLKGRAAAGSEVLYRVDYLKSGAKKFTIGVLFAGDMPETFLRLLGSNTRSGSPKADIMGISGYLEAHLALCRLERLAREGIASKGKGWAGTEDYRKADSSYYREILAYVEKGRRYLNGDAADFGILPHFPERSVFMAGWYREHKGRQQEDKRETAQKMEGA